MESCSNGARAQINGRHGAYRKDYTDLHLHSRIVSRQPDTWQPNPSEESQHENARSLVYGTMLLNADGGFSHQRQGTTGPAS